MGKIITISRDEIQGAWLTPPENQGQIVEVSYACTEDYILRCWHDRSDGETRITAYDWPAKDEPFAPWQSVPSHGRRRGVVEITD